MNITLTTNHATSSYDMPVALIDGTAYGPDDLVDGVPVGSAVAIATDHKSKPVDIELALRFVRQSAANGQRWQQIINSQVHAAPAEFANEGDM